MHLTTYPSNILSKNWWIERRNSSVIIVEGLNIPFSKMSGINRQKINKDMENFNNTINKLHLLDILEYPFNSSRIHILLKCTHISLQKRPYVSPYNKFKMIEIIQNMFSDHNWWNENKKQMEILETDKYLYINNVLLNNKWVKEIKGGLENTLKWMKMKNLIYQNLWMQLK